MSTEIFRGESPQEAVQGVLFDLDGTLLDTEHLILVSFRHAVKTVLGKEIPDEVLMAKVGQPLNTQMWDFTDDEAVHERLCRVYREYNAEVHDDLIELFPGTEEMLVQLKAEGYSLGVVTSKRHGAAAAGLAFFKLENYFDFLIGSDDWPEHKPKPGPVLHGCDLMGLKPSACLYVGDSPFDIQAGNAAGCTTVAALWVMFSAEELEAEHPHVTCSTTTDLLELLKPKAR